MNNRFGHLKKRSKTPKNVEEFIEAAEKPKRVRVARRQRKKEGVLLSVSGKMDRGIECDKPIRLFIKKDINQDIDKFCTGNKQGIINFLIRKGLDEIIKDGKALFIEE